MSFLLIRYNDNWADEMNINGLAIVHRDAWQEILEETEKYFNTNSVWECSIGTNEDLEFSSYIDWLRKFTITELSDSEGITLMLVFKRVNIVAIKENRLVVKEGFFPIPHD